MPVNPNAFNLQGYSRRPPAPWRPVATVALAVFVVGLLATWGLRRLLTRREVPPPPVVIEQPVVNPAPVIETPPAIPARWRAFVIPTDRTNLLDAPLAETIQDTGGGNPESGTYGTVRTASSGLGQFHEGIDIKVVSRDRRGQPLDKAYAAADGTVAYASRVAGNSNYGRYVVVRHADRIGDVFTLYAHLAEIADGIRPGAPVVAGQTVIGVVGNSSSGGIPLERAHLHFEIGLMVNAQFDAWYRGQKMKPDHGNWHGWNLLGVNPLDALRFARDHGGMSYGEFLATVKTGVCVTVKAPRLPDFFQRHPALWQGAAFTGEPITISANENGAILAGRLATSEEKAKLGTTQAAITFADAVVLGRNGRRLAVSAGGGQWKLGQNGQEWLAILLYPARLR